MKHRTVWVWIVMLALLCTPARAAETPVIVETKMETDEQMIAFIKNSGKSGATGAMLGKISSEEVSGQTIQEAGIAIKTLILVDNSLSIPEALRPEITSQLLELVAARKNNEYFAFGTVSDQVKILQDFSDDYTLLKKAIEGLLYNYQDTFLTDALYDYWIEQPFESSTNSYERILLISDGVDNKSLGYTKDELLDLLKTNPLPIYTIGIETQVETNPQELENMFALSRAAGGESVLFSELGVKTELTAILQKDWDTLAVKINIPEAARDGSLQTLTVQLGPANAVLDGVRMPLSEKVEEEPAQPQTIIVQQEAEPEKPVLMYVLIAVLGTVLLIGIVAAVILVLRAKKNKNAFQALSEEALRKRIQEEEGATVFIGAGGGDDDGTQRIWDDHETCRITLTDIHSVERCYQKPIAGSLIIGLSRDSDICINYDKSVSRKHCEIVREGEDFFIINHSESNGTFVNGIRVTGKMQVSDGCIIKMGRVEMRLEISS